MTAIPLHLAAFDGDNEAVNQFLAVEGNAVDALTDDKETPLLFAVTGGHTAVVRTLLKWGADVNLLPAHGNSALRRAIQNGHAEIVGLLLANGADPEAIAPPKLPAPEEKAKERDRLKAMMDKFRTLREALSITESEPDEDEDKAINELLADTPENSPSPKQESGTLRCLSFAIQSRSVETLKVLLEAGYSPNPPRDEKPTINLLDFARSTAGETAIEMARLLLKHGANPNGDDEESLTSPLMTAVMAGNIPFARLLIDAGATTTSSALETTSLLTISVMQQNMEMVAFLLDQNIGLDDPNLHIFTMDKPELRALINEKRGAAWLSLVKAGDIEGVRAAIENGVDLTVEQDREGSALEIAIKNGDLAMVEILLEAGMDAKQRNDYDATPLHQAASQGSAEIIALLLERGADASAEDKFGQTPILRAARNGHIAASDLLLAHGARLSVVEAILLGRKEETQAFYDSGTPVDYANERKMTALHAAALVGDIDLAADLLRRGADPNATDSGDRTPLHDAISKENEQIVVLLLDNGAVVKGYQDFHSSPLDHALMMRNEPITRLLLQRGAPARKPKTDADGSGGRLRINWDWAYDPLSHLLMIHKATVENKSASSVPVWRDVVRLWAVMRTLLEFGADPNSRDADGKPLLECLISFDAPFDLIHYAMEKGAPVNPTSDFGDAPLMWAVRKGRADVVEALLVAGAHPNGGLTTESPLAIARKEKRTEIVALLEKHGASEETREAVFAQAGDQTPLWLMPVPDETRPAVMPLLGFSGMMENAKANRIARIAERRERLEAEVRGGG